MTVAPTTRERIVEAAVAMTTESGWSGGDHGRARRAGRREPADGLQRGRLQGGARRGDDPARARPLPRRGRRVAFDQHPDDLVDAIRAASSGVLELAQDNKLLHAVVSATHGADTELLPLLTTHAESLLAAAKLVVTERVTPYDIGLDGPHLDVAIDVVVRVVLSHVMQPSGAPAETADDIAWLAGRALRADFSGTRQLSGLQAEKSGSRSPGSLAGLPTCASSTASRNACATYGGTLRPRWCAQSSSRSTREIWPAKSSTSRSMPRVASMSPKSAFWRGVVGADRGEGEAAHPAHHPALPGRRAAAQRPRAESW